MNKEEVDKFCKEYYGFTLEDADGSIGYWMGKYQELEQENEKLKERIDIAIEYIEENKIKSKYSRAECGFDIYIVLKESEINDLLEILKDSDVDV